MSSTLINVVVPFEGKFLVVSKDGTIIMNANIKDIFRQKVPLKWVEKSIDLEGHFYDKETKKHIYYRSFTDPYWLAFTIIDDEKHNEFINDAPQSLIYIISVCLIIYVILLCLCRVYIREVTGRLYMGVNGISYDGQAQDLEKNYTKIKNSQVELKEVRRISGEDALTEIWRKFDDRMAELIDCNSPFYLAILDLDNFKSIIDTFGHTVGDSVLKYVSKIGLERLGVTHSIYRFGGEELVAIFCGITFAECYEIIDSWRYTVSRRKWREQNLTVTFSCGIASSGDSKTLDEIVASADKSLYEAKESGKNCIYPPLS